MDVPVLPPNTCVYCFKTLKTAQGLAKHTTSQPQCQLAAAAVKTRQQEAALQLGPILVPVQSADEHESMPVYNEDVDVPMYDNMPSPGEGKRLLRR